MQLGNKMPQTQSKVKPKSKTPVPAAAPTARFTSDDIHRALFPSGPPKRRTFAELKEGIRRHMHERYANRGIRA
jgi:hypothetical protein